MPLNLGVILNSLEVSGAIRTAKHLLLCAFGQFFCSEAQQRLLVEHLVRRLGKQAAQGVLHYIPI